MPAGFILGQTLILIRYACVGVGSRCSLELLQQWCPATLPGVVT